MWEERARRARRDVVALASSGLGASDLHAAAIRVMAEGVGCDLACWAVIDPETLVISTMTSGANRISAEYEPRLAEAEYSGAEPHTFASMVRGRRPVAKLSEMPDRDRERSIRLNDVWRPLGLDCELRVLFQADGACWGAAGMVRAGHDFSDRETDYFSAVAPALAAATRLAVRSEARNSPTNDAPAIVVVGTHGELRAATPAATAWQDRLNEIAPGRFTVMMQVVALGARSAGNGYFRMRARDARGQWAVLQASPLIGGDEDQIAVSIEPATGDQLLGLLLAAYELTPRERDVCREVIAGRSTADIADRLFISAHTVQDHLKSVFAKVGVRSRGELVASLRPEGVHE